MIVSESDTLLAALDRRLAVDRILALDPLAAVEPDAAPSLGAEAPALGAEAPSDAGPVASPPARLPANTALAPGAIVAARVVEAPAADHVLVDIGRLRVALAWPSANGPLPTVGRDVALRVLACAPTLLFETLQDDAVHPRATDVPARLSADAMHLQSPTSHAGALVRFSTPILSIATADPGHPTAASGTNAITATSTAVVERLPDAAVPLPLVLQGPAWPGQDVELVVRRDRADEAFDNAALDQWCGEIVIALPHLGRVAGHLGWSMQGLRVRLEGEDAEATATLSAAIAELATALAGAELPVLALTVGRPVASLPERADRG